MHREGIFGTEASCSRSVTSTVGFVAVTIVIDERWTYGRKPLHVLKLKDWPGWRNWQTQRAQNPPRFTPRGGSTPPPGTNPSSDLICCVLLSRGCDVRDRFGSGSYSGLHVGRRFMFLSLIVPLDLPLDVPVEPHDEKNQVCGVKDVIFYRE